MNVEHIQQIFSHYIEKFALLNNNEHDENFKWYITGGFHRLMDDALSASISEFPDTLLRACKFTQNIIDSYTQPFYGLVEFARKEPETVRQMFVDLYSGDNGDLHVQEKKIEDFFDQSKVLLDKYFSGSYRYKQNSHSVSAYLFLYDPDHHYMYKAEQSRIFADCIEFYEDWGTGDNIKLDVYYRMCDWLIEQIMSSRELLTMDASRFEADSDGKMFPDEAKHVLAFDLIYCCSVYNLFDGISFSRPKSKEKQLIIEKKNKAAKLLEAYERAKADKERLAEAYEVLEKELQVGEWLIHKKYGRGKILSYDKQYIEIYFQDIEEIKRFGVMTLFANNIVKLERKESACVIEDIVPFLKRREGIERIYGYSEKELQPYLEYLD